GGHTDGIAALAFSTDGRTVATAGHEGSVRLWDSGTGNEIRRLPGFHGYVTTLALSSDGQTIAIANATDTMYLGPTATTTPLRAIPARQQHVRSLAFAPDGRTLISGGGSDAPIRLWDAVTSAELKSYARPGKGACAVAYSPDGQTIAAVDDAFLVL